MVSWIVDGTLVVVGASVVLGIGLVGIGVVILSVVAVLVDVSVEAVVVAIGVVSPNLADKSGVFGG